MFRAPHDVQLVLHGAFLQEDAGHALPPTFSDRLHTFVPEPLSLDALRTGALHEIEGRVFLGNFEDGGTPLGHDVRFRVDGVVHEHVLDAGAEPTELGYLLFGTRDETFAAHVLTGAPGFDEIVRVELGPGAPTDEELAHGAIARARGVPDGTAFRLGAAAAPMTMTAFDSSFEVSPRVTVSCLVGPGFFAPCD
jgi:hypothetical protein